jgi:hypothetical protein
MRENRGVSEKLLQPRRLLPALIVLLLLGFAVPAGASPAGGSGVRPFAEGEGIPTITKPEDQHSLVGTAVSFTGAGTEMVTLKSEGLPAGLNAARVSPTAWQVTGTPLTPTSAATVTVTVENSKLETAETKFTWTVAGIISPGDQITVVNAPVEVPVTGVELAELKATPANPLPAGLTPEKITEGEWRIVGTPGTPSETEVELQAETGAKGLPSPVKFKWTVAGINNPGPQLGTVGVVVSLPITGAGLQELTLAKPLPAGLSLEKVSEAEWRVVGTPKEAGKLEVELHGEDASKALPSALFTWTIAEAEKAPPPTPPSASGTLTVSPEAAFSAAKSTCGGLTWSPSTVSTRWLLDGVPIGGATAAVYVAPRVFDGRALSCRQTAVTAQGAWASVTSAGVTVHEQPPQPFWAIGPASQRCASPVCMQDGGSPQSPATRSYQQGGSWWAASQVRCISAPWTSIAGTSSLASVELLAEAQSVTVSLLRVTSTGTVTLASQQLGSLRSPRDEIDGSANGAPFAGNIAASFGPQAFTAGELWPRLFPGSLGKPDRFAAGQGYIAYQLAGGTGVMRSFQLLYNLTAADLRAHLRCTVSAQDGPAASPTSATLTSPEYTVSGARGCAPRQLGHIGGPQPALAVIGSRLCLEAPSGLSEIGGRRGELSVVAGRSAVVVECTLASGCSGKLTLASGERNLASAPLSLRRGARRLVSLKLDGQARARLKKAGSGGLAVSLNLAGRTSTRRLLSLTLLAAG